MVKSKKKPEPKPDEPISIEYKDMWHSNQSKTTPIDPTINSIVLYNDGRPITILKINNANKFRYIQLYRNANIYINIKSSVDTSFCIDYNLYDIFLIKTIIIPENEKIVYNYKVNENEVLNFIVENFSSCTVLQDRRIQDGCSA